MDATCSRRALLFLLFFSSSFFIQRTKATFFTLIARALLSLPRSRYVFLSLFSRVHFFDDDVLPLFSAARCLALFFGDLSPFLRRLQRRSNLVRPGLGRNVRPGREADEKPRRDVRHGLFHVRKPGRVRRREWGHHGDVHGGRGRRDDDGTWSSLIV